VVAELEIWLGGEQHRLAAALIAPVITASVAVRRARPLLVGIGVPIVFALGLAFWGDLQFVAVAVAYFCALYALSVWAPPRRFVAGLMVLVVADLLSSAGPQATLGDSVPFAVVTPLVMLVVRRVVGDRERRVQLAERERDFAAREAVATERARIARELHDVVAHGVSVMVVQAQAGPRLLADPVQARGAFVAIETTGREALVELRRLLCVLRGGEEGAATAPQPGLDSLESLLEQVREAGLRVDLRIEGEPAQLPLGVDLSAYRIVQEALTNTLKHAGRAEVEVIVRYHPTVLALEVLDNGTGAPERVNGSGHGLVGMRERVAIYGGTLEVGRRNGHGFSVLACLPLAPGAAG